MTGVVDFSLEDTSNPMSRGDRRRRSEPTWRWQRVGVAGNRSRLQLRVDHRAGEDDTTVRLREHISYLTRMAAEGVLSPKLATKAKTVWRVAEVSAGGSLPVPAAAAFSGGPVEYHWSVGPHQLSAEIPAEGPCHWTYRNIKTGELWGVETADDGFPPQLNRALTRIAESSR